MSEVFAQTSELQRRQRRAVRQVNALRNAAGESPEEHYFSQCHALCINGSKGLEFNAVRAIVWRDMVLGLGASSPTPFLSQNIIRRAQLHRHLSSRRQEEEAASPVDTDDALPAMSSVGSDFFSSTSQDHLALSQSVANPSCVEGCGDNSGDRADSSAQGSAGRRRRAVSVDVPRWKSFAVATLTTTAPVPLSAGVGSPPLTKAELTLPDNCQPRVVEADVQRSLWTLYPETTERNEMRRRLKDMLLRALANNPDRYYYQGLHELMGFVMFVLTPNMTSEEIVSVGEGLLCTRWRSFSEPTLNVSESLLYAMHAVIAEEDPALAMALERCGVAPESHYAVSWIITWYAHTVSHTAILGRLFDFFIAAEDGLSVVFFTAAFVVSERERILQWVADAEEEALEYGNDSGVITMAKVYALLNKLPDKVLASFTVDETTVLVQKAEQYRMKHLQLVHYESDNYLHGVVRKLGYLANRRTRNAALRLLWSMLPREWRNPVKRRQGVGRLVLAASAALGVALVVVSSRDHAGFGSLFFGR